MTYRGFDQPYDNEDFGPDDVVVDGDWLARELDVLDEIRAVVINWQSTPGIHSDVAMSLVQEAMEASVHEPHEAGAGHERSSSSKGTNA